MQKVIDWMGRNPIASLVIAALLFFSIWYVGSAVSFWWFERGVEQADQIREENKEKVNQLETESAQDEAVADSEM